ncbi:MAG: HEAT repeat domain-containing protein, partial [Planctomycetales bacterium]|nr:HEAT repeat domain-containing protein [Planctomycetales bacterium]
VIEAFLLIARPGNTTLTAVLSDPFHPAHLAVVDQLLHSPTRGVMSLLLNYLEEQTPPSAALTALGKRSDIAFLRHMLRRIKGHVAKTVAANLRRIQDVAWIGNPAEVIDALDGDEQGAAIEMLMATRVRRLDVFRAVAYTLANGEPAGRRAAAVALAEFSGSEANNLAAMALDDDDPQVQATIILQVRSRGIPGVLSRLLDFAESPHDVVRTALRKTLDEFNFERFFASFDKLDDQVRDTTASLVRRIDHRAAELLGRELASPSPTRRLQALAVADVMGLVSEVEQRIIDLLDDTDHAVRGEVVRVLASSPSDQAVQALLKALGDSNDLVREAAEASLLEIRQLRAEAAELNRDTVVVERSPASDTVPRDAGHVASAAEVDRSPSDSGATSLELGGADPTADAVVAETTEARRSSDG